MQKSEWLASGSSDNTVRLWEVKSGKELHCFGGYFSGHTSGVSSVAFDAKGEQLASGSWDKTVRLWDIKSGKELHCLKGHTDEVYSVAFDAQGKRLASGGNDGWFRLWDVITGNQLLARYFQHRLAVVRSVAFDPTGQRLAVGIFNTVRLVDVTSGEQLRCFTGQQGGEVLSVAFDVKGRRLISGSKDKTIRLWDVESGKELHCFSGHTGEVNWVTFDMKGEKLMSGSADQTVRFWDALSGKELRGSNSGHKLNVYSIAFDVKHQRLASGGSDAVRLWDITNGKELCCLTGHKHAVNCVAFNATGERLASGSEDCTVRIWDVANGKELLCLEGHTEGVKSVAFDAKEERLVSSAGNHENSINTVRLWDIASGKQLRCFGGCCSGGCFGRCFGCKPFSDIFDAFFDMPFDGCCCFPFYLDQHSAWVNTVAFDAKSLWLASAGTNIIQLWDVVSGEQLRRFGVNSKFSTGHRGLVNSVAFDAKGEWLASGGDDHTVRLWDLKSESSCWNACLDCCGCYDSKEFYCFSGHTKAVTSVVFDPTGELLASGSRDKTVRVWEIATRKTSGCLTFPYEVVSCVWGKLHAAQEFLGVAFGSSIACFTVVMKKDTLQTQLNWLVASGSPLFTDRLNLTGVKGLSANNHTLLQQREAIGKPASLVEELVSSGDEKSHIPNDAKIDVINKNKSITVDSKALVASSLSASPSIDQKSLIASRSVSSPGLAQLAVQHSPLFSPSMKDQRSSPTHSSDVRVAIKQQPLEVNNNAPDKAENNASSSKLSCSLM